MKLTKNSPWSPNHKNLPTSHHHRTAATQEMISEAVHKMNEQNIPMKDRKLFVTPSQLRDLKMAGQNSPMDLSSTVMNPAQVGKIQGTWMGVNLHLIP